jgi:valyl-tRNA synthetase
MEWLQQVIVAIRNIRGEMNLSPSKPLPILVKQADANAQQRLTSNQAFFNALAKLESVTFLAADQEAPASATALVGRMEIHIPMAGLIDTAAELARLDKAIEKAQKEVDLFSRKLSNDNFVSKAPADVIEKERAKQAEAQETLQQLLLQRAKIAAL